MKKKPKSLFSLITTITVAAIFLLNKADLRLSNLVRISQELFPLVLGASFSIIPFRDLSFS